jgi:hypothetical protein
MMWHASGKKSEQRLGPSGCTDVIEFGKRPDKNDRRVGEQ